MDELSLRFPHLAEGIFNSLDNQSLSNCRIVNNSWKNYLDQQKFFHIRKIKENITTFHVIGEPWELIFRKAGIDILRKLFYAVRKSFKSCRSNMNTHGLHFGCIAYDDQSATPLLVAAAYGDFKFFKRMMDLSEVKNPKTEEFETLLCLAAEKGNFRICRLLLKTLDDMGWKEFLDDSKIMDLLRGAAEEGNFQIFKLLIHTLHGEKNAMVTVDDDIDWTLLTISAKHGHWEICELIMKNIKVDENPRNVEYDYKTSLEVAAQEGHVKVCKLFMDYFKDKSVKKKKSIQNLATETFSTAMYQGHLEVCKLILEYFDEKNAKIEFVYEDFHEAALLGHYHLCELIMNIFHAAGIKDKNPANEDPGDQGETPLHKAAKNGHVKICKLILENVVDKCPISEKGMTPLHWSARCGHSETCQMILQNIDKEEASIQCFKCYVCKEELRTKEEFSAHYASDHEGVEPSGMTPYDYAVYKRHYCTAEVFRKYLEIPETDPRTGERIFYLKYLEEPDAKKHKFGPE